jgi:3-isopropylmalate/(R)-2-methylmalate dehydratase large subunit
MAMTAVSKIIAARSGQKEVEPGQFVSAKVDLVMCNDITAPLAVKTVKELGVRKVFDKEKITFVESHYVPAKDIASAINVQELREFVKEQDIKWFFPNARGGIEHSLLPEEGVVVPGQLIVGADSHTPTYGALGNFAAGFGSTDAGIAMATGEVWLRVPETIKINLVGEKHPWVVGKDLVLRVIGEIGVEGANYQMLEYHGPVLQQISVDDRLTIANMAAEAQAKGAFFHVDDITREYVKDRAKFPIEIFESDPDAKYVREVTIDVTGMEPQVAFPYSPDNVHPLREALGVRPAQVFIGSCTNARISDMRVVAGIMKGKKVHNDVQCIVIPATQDIYKQALKEGLIEIFADAGAVVAAGTCGPCLGGYMGVMGPNDVCISTSNRNFPGRMGHKDAKVYLANPAVAAAAAVAGEIVPPESIQS